MFDNLQNALALIGRLLLALIFATSGVGKIAGFAATAGHIGSKELPAPALLAALALVVELGGGLAVAFGFMTKWAALTLAAFCVLAGVLFHAFWAVPADQVMNTQIHFFKNISIAGGFLMLAAFGPGVISLDAKRRR